jgi:hypothetical protein
MGSTVPVRRSADHAPCRRLWTAWPPSRSCGASRLISDKAADRMQNPAGKGTAPVGGTTGAVDAPSSGGEELVRRFARPRGGANRSMVDHQVFNGNFPRVDVAEIFGREMAPRRTGCHRPWTRPGDQACICVVVAPGQARHDRSTSGLPARGCPWDSRWSSDSRTSTCLMSTPLRSQSEPLTFGPHMATDHHCAGSGPAQLRRPARTASQTSRPPRAAATTASAQCPNQSATPSELPVPYAASAPR